MRRDEAVDDLGGDVRLVAQQQDGRVYVRGRAEKTFDARPAVAALATFESASWTADFMSLVRMLPGGADVPDVWEQVERYSFTATADAE